MAGEQVASGVVVGMEIRLIYGGSCVHGNWQTSTTSPRHFQINNTTIIYKTLYTLKSAVCCLGCWLLNIMLTKLGLWPSSFWITENKC